ncbi:MAG: FtsW/RodA/SpoVE family cell cycle protein [Verrucomicrobia bacterium]|nr:FtsW/RodA/SpoVE family cell cycle protein [Verrucomicrobiota bacterium]
MNRTITVLLGAVAGLLVLGLATLASITMSRATPGADWLHPWLVKQALACGIGFAGLMAAAFVDYRRLDRLVWAVYLVALILLALVLTPLGTNNKGAQRWLWGTQPSEFAKLALILVLSWYAVRFQHRMATFTGGILGMGAIAVPMLGLIVIEPDKGTTLLLGAVTMALMLVGGARWSQVMVPLVAGLAAFAVLLSVPGYARDRVQAFLNPGDNKSLTYQVDRGMDAFGAGGWHGAGFGRGTHKFKVPEVHTDFILPAVGEELGLPATLGVVVAFAFILFCGALIAHWASDGFGMMLASGITFVIGLQALVNLGVVTHLLPNKGMALPFMSRGGTGTVVLLTMIGLLISVARQAHVPTAANVGSAVPNPFGSTDTDFPE